MKKEIKGVFSKRDESNLGLHRKHVDVFDNQSGAVIEERSFLDAEQSTATWTILGSDGNERGKITDLRPRGYLTRSPKGKYFMLSHSIGEGYGMDGKVTLFDSLGKKIKEQPLFDWEGKDTIVFSDDGGYAVVFHYGMGKGGLAILDSLGNVVGKHEEDNWQALPPSSISERKVFCEIMPQNRQVAFITSEIGSPIESFDFKGNRLWKFSELCPKDGRCNPSFTVSPDGKMVVAASIGSAGTSLLLINSNTGAVSKKVEVDLQLGEFKKGQVRFTRLLPFEDQFVFIFSNVVDKATGNYTNGVFAFDYEGNLIQKKPITHNIRRVKGDSGSLEIIQDGGR